MNCVEGGSLTDQVCVTTYETSMGNEILCAKLVGRSLLHEECATITSMRCTIILTAMSAICVGSTSMWASSTGMSAPQGFVCYVPTIFVGNLEILLLPSLFYLRRGIWDMSTQRGSNELSFPSVYHNLVNTYISLHTQTCVHACMLFFKAVNLQATNGLGLYKRALKTAYQPYKLHLKEKNKKSHISVSKEEKI